MTVYIHSPSKTDQNRNFTINNTYCQPMSNYRYIPNKLEIAIVVPVFKKGDKDLLNNYRPISMLLSISKILETVIYNQLYEYLQEHRVITNSQYGF